MELTPTDPSFCAATIIPVSLGHVSGALVIPAEEVRIHGPNVVEVIAPVGVREALDLKDGDEITLVVQAGAAGPGLFSPLIKAVIFDLDGTLIDTKEIFFLIVEKAFEKLRIPIVSRPTMVEAAAEGEFNWDMILPEASKGNQGDILSRIRVAIDEISPSLFEENRLIEGAAELLRTLSAANMVLGMVTSTRARHMSLKLGPLEEAGLEALFQTVVTADDAARQKPAPDPLLECARRLGIAPGHCLYVGDMRMDIRAGKSAGMRTVGVLTGFDTRAALEAEEPDMILDSIADLREKLGLME
jgi:HAD superfamily hydrolase (TIGR01509 family)